ncbi:membrane hypothetical protein [Candidatus Magnetomoraceae bacterium gMMP-1]
MTIWYPDSGISWSHYLQAESFKKDNTNQLVSLEFKISAQTKQLVANNQDLIRSFGNNFNITENTLEFVFDATEDSVNKLNADFNYNIGPILQKLEIENNQKNILNKLDSIHETLLSPVLTQAKEYYRIACDRIRKGFLDKALEAFKLAEKKNDTDSLLHYHIGMLYLYGVNKYVNVINLSKAKKHFALAYRYAKAETDIDKTFSKLSAECLLHASIANYALLYDIKKNYPQELLIESKYFLENAIILNPDFLEAHYHLAKFEALLSEIENSISNLKLLIERDRNYILKIYYDKAFDKIRPDILIMLEKLMEKTKKQVNQKNILILNIIKKLKSWKIQNSNSFFNVYKQWLKKIESINNLYKLQTYFSFLDAIPLMDSALKESKDLIVKRQNELRTEVQQVIESALSIYHNDIINNKKKLSNSDINEIDKTIERLMQLIKKAKYLLEQNSYEIYNQASIIAATAYDKASQIANLLSLKQKIKTIITYTLDSISSTELEFVKSKEYHFFSRKEFVPSDKQSRKAHRSPKLIFIFTRTRFKVKSISINFNPGKADAVINQAIDLIKEAENLLSQTSLESHDKALKLVNKAKDKAAWANKTTKEVIYKWSEKKCEMIENYSWNGRLIGGLIGIFLAILIAKHFSYSILINDTACVFLLNAAWIFSIITFMVGFIIFHILGEVLRELSGWVQPFSFNERMIVGCSAVFCIILGIIICGLIGYYFGKMTAHLIWNLKKRSL